MDVWPIKPYDKADKQTKVIFRLVIADSPSAKIQSSGFCHE